MNDREEQKVDIVNAADELRDVECKLSFLVDAVAALSDQDGVALSASGLRGLGAFLSDPLRTTRQLADQLQLAG